MKRILLLASALLVAPLLGSDAERQLDNATTLAMNIEGKWHLVGLSRGGRQEMAPAYDMVFHAGGKYAWESGGMPIVQGTYTAIADRLPGQLDLAPNNVVTARGIFRVEGDTLIIALHEPEGTRPQGFGDDALKVLTLKRVKK
jgi:uncharacterized protein (TIGR03067 family)